VTRWYTGNMRIVALIALGASLVGSTFAATLPRPLPGFTFRTPMGGVIDLTQYKGKVVALEFLLTTCPHCQRCARVLQKMQTEFGPKGFQAIGVATNDMAHMLVPEFMRNFGISFPVGFAQREAAHDFLDHPRNLILYYPNVVFIDRKGMIRAQFLGGDAFFNDEENNVRKQILGLLNDSASAKPGALPPPKTAASKTTKTD